MISKSHTQFHLRITHPHEGQVSKEIKMVLLLKLTEQRLISSDSTKLSDEKVIAYYSN